MPEHGSNSGEAGKFSRRELFSRLFSRQDVDDSNEDHSVEQTAVSSQLAVDPVEPLSKSDLSPADTPERATRSLQTPEPKTSRRHFLSQLRNAFLGLYLAPRLDRFAFHRSEVPAAKEILNTTPRNILIIDFPTGADAEITENGITDYSLIEQQVFAAMPERYLTREQLSELLQQSLEDYGPNGSVVVEPASFDNPWPELTQDIIALGYPELAAWYSYLKKYRTHGEQVANAAQTSWDMVGQSGERQLLSLGNFLQPETVNFMTDEWGNSGIRMRLSAEQMIPQIQSYVDSHPEFMQDGVINMSLQLGEVKTWIASQSAEEAFPHRPTENLFFDRDTGQELRVIIPQAEVDIVFDQYLHIVGEENGVYILEHQNPETPDFRPQYRGYADRSQVTAAINQAFDQYRLEYPHEANNPRSREDGAYTGENRLEHARELVTIANAFPDIFFCVAAGNNADDLRGLYTDTLRPPDNLLIIGEWTSMWEFDRPAFGVTGADFYISNEIAGELISSDSPESIDLGRGSSFSTPQVSALVSVLRGRGIPINQIRGEINKLSSLETFPVDREHPEGEKDSALVISQVTADSILSLPPAETNSRPQ